VRRQIFLFGSEIFRNVFSRFTFHFRKCFYDIINRIQHEDSAVCVHGDVKTAGLAFFRVRADSGCAARPELLRPGNHAQEDTLGIVNLNAYQALLAGNKAAVRQYSNIYWIAASAESIDCCRRLAPPKLDISVESICLIRRRPGLTTRSNPSLDTARSK
jgi:hypothetical protein